MGFDTIFINLVLSCHLMKKKKEYWVALKKGLGFQFYNNASSGGLLLTINRNLSHNSLYFLFLNLGALDETEHESFYFNTI